jgi:hypothetical protein
MELSSGSIQAYLGDRILVTTSDECWFIFDYLWRSVGVAMSVF